MTGINGLFFLLFMLHLARFLHLNKKIYKKVYNFHLRHLQYDLRAQRLFLKRIPVEGVEERDLYLGNTIVVLSRQLKITDYADAFTRDQITSKRQR